MQLEPSLQSSMPGAVSSEGLAQEYLLASWGRRFAAILLDAIAFNVLANLVLLPFSLIFFGSLVATDLTGDDTFKVGAFLLSLAVTVPLFLIYYPYMIARTNGQTFGKKVLKIRIIREGAEPMTFWYAVYREGLLKTLGGGVLVVIIVIGWIVLVLNYLWPLKDDENRTFYDMLAKTRVIDEG